MGKTMRAIMARRLKFTDELLANVRQRFETTDEPLSTMAADLGCCKTTLRGIARREGWVRYVPPPRDLIPAARLLAQAETLSASLHPPLEGEGRSSERSEGERGGVSDREGSPPPASLRSASAGDLPPPGGGEERERAGEERETAEALHAAVVKELAEFKALRAQIKGKPLGLLERERAARTLAGLTRTLHTLQAMRCGVALPESHSDDAYDDMPADLDEFRDELARRIRIFVEGRRARSGAGAACADDAVAARS